MVKAYQTLRITVNTTYTYTVATAFVDEYGADLPEEDAFHLAQVLNAPEA
jgi:hypothetical protein